MSATRLRTQAQEFGYSSGRALFSVNKGFDMIDALEHASSLLDIASRLTLNVACETAGSNEAHAAQHLSEMAKALVDACIGGAITGKGGAQ
ncbi:DUF3077 domain-containing protein [Stutzerimonas frequens]